MARRKQSPFEDLIEVTAMFPWWAGVLLAVATYMTLHYFAGQQVAAPKDIKGLGEFAGKQLWITLAMFGQYVLPVAFLIGAGISAYGRWKRNDLHSRASASPSAGVLDEMTWREFEMLVGESFRRRGFSVLETGGASADGGVDLVLAKGSEKFLVQCKQWKALKVGVTTVRELYGVMAAKRATGVFVVTSGEFTKDATEFASGRNIELIDGPKLKTMLRGVRRNLEPAQDVQPQPVPRATEVSDAKTRQSVSAPTCPRCGGTMTKRIAKQGASAGKPFWGCTGFPSCRGTRPIE